VNLTVIVLLSPFLLLTARPGGSYKNFFVVGRVWGMLTMLGLGLIPRPARYTLKHKGPVVLAPNHGSDLDIPMTFIAAPTPVIFMGKAELLKLPIFGYFFKQTSIPVDRKSFSGRKQALIDADQKVKEGYSVCLYPEGRVPTRDHLLTGFKAGAFKLAVDNNIPVVPMSIYQNKYRFGDWNETSSLGRVDAKILGEFWPDLTHENPVQELMDRCYQAMAKDLVDFGLEGKLAVPLKA
jgi:1-acyl-sn-glycerol-3-phosphate acyltransferase